MLNNERLLFIKKLLSNYPNNALNMLLICCWVLFEKPPKNIGQTNTCLSLITAFGMHSTCVSCSTELSIAFRFFSEDIHGNDTDQREGLRGRKDVLYYLPCHWREFTSQVGGKYGAVGFVAGRASRWPVA